MISEEKNLSVLIDKVEEYNIKINCLINKAKENENFSTQLLLEAEFNSFQLQRLFARAISLDQFQCKEKESLLATKNNIVDLWMINNNDDLFSFNTDEDLRVPYDALTKDIDIFKYKSCKLYDYIKNILRRWESFIEIFKYAVESTNELEDFPCWNFGIGTTFDLISFN